MIFWRRHFWLQKRPFTKNSSDLITPAHCFFAKYCTIFQAKNVLKKRSLTFITPGGGSELDRGIFAGDLTPCARLKPARASPSSYTGTNEQGRMTIISGCRPIGFPDYQSVWNLVFNLRFSRTIRFSMFFQGTKKIWPGEGLRKKPKIWNKNQFAAIIIFFKIFKISKV